MEEEKFVLNIIRTYKTLILKLMLLVRSRCSMVKLICGDVALGFNCQSS